MHVHSFIALVHHDIRVAAVSFVELACKPHATEVGMNQAGSIACLLLQMCTQLPQSRGFSPHRMHDACDGCASSPEISGGRSNHARTLFTHLPQPPGQCFLDAKHLLVVVRSSPHHLCASARCSSSPLCTPAVQSRACALLLLSTPSALQINPSALRSVASSVLRRPMTANGRQRFRQRTGWHTFN